MLDCVNLRMHYFTYAFARALTHTVTVPICSMLPSNLPRYVLICELYHASKTASNRDEVGETLTSWRVDGWRVIYTRTNVLTWWRPINRSLRCHPVARSTCNNNDTRRKWKTVSYTMRRKHSRPAATTARATWSLTRFDCVHRSHESLSGQRPRCKVVAFVTCSAEFIYVRKRPVSIVSATTYENCPVQRYSVVVVIIIMINHCPRSYFTQCSFFSSDTL